MTKTTCDVCARDIGWHWEKDGTLSGRFQATPMLPISAFDEGHNDLCDPCHQAITQAIKTAIEEIKAKL